MTFRNEILEGIAAYKAMTPTSQDAYYNEKAKTAKRENDQYEEQNRGDATARAAAAALKAQANPLIPTASRSDTIGSGPPSATPSVVPTQTAGSIYQGLARGGRVRRFADGGFAGGLASGIKSTFRMPQRRQQALRTTAPNSMDAGIDGSQEIAQQAVNRYGPVYVPPPDTGSANAATGSGGDSTGGVSGTGGVGGSASAGEGGSAAAGTSGGAADAGDGGGTYRRGGRVSRGRAIRTNYRAGGAVTPRSRDRDEEWEREPEFPDDEMFHPPPVRNDSGPHDDNSNVIQEPEDEDYFLRHPQAPQPPPRREVPTMQSGGRVPRYDAGGGIEADDQTWREIEARNAADVARRRAMNPSAPGAAFRGGRPEFDPSQTPEAGRRNEADEVIRSILNADLPDPESQVANDPSIELRERGERDRALTTLPPPSPDDLPAVPQPPSAAAQRGAARRQGQLPKATAAAGPPKDQDPSTRAALEATFQSPVPTEGLSTSPPVGPGPDTDDATLSTGNATQPPGDETDDATLSTGNAREPPDAERDYRRQFPIPSQDQPLSPEEVARIKATTTVPATSRFQDWSARGNSEEAANARESQDDWRKRMRERKEQRGKATGEVKAATPGIFEKLTPQQQQELRDRREAAGKVSESTEPPDVVYPQKESELRALETTPPPPPAVEGTTNLPAKKVDPLTASGESRRNKRLGVTTDVPYGPPAPTAEQRAVQTGARPAAVEGTAGVGEQATAAAPAGLPPPPPGRPAQLGPEGVAGTTTPPSAASSVAPPVASQQGPEGGGTTTAAAAPPPKNNGTSTPGGPPGATTTPPAGSAPANRPSTAEKPETRVAAYDPSVDRADPTTGRTLPRQLDAQGRAIVTGPPPPQVAQGDGGPPSGAGSLTSATGYSNHDIATTLNGAATLVRPSANGGPPPPGHLAASRPVFNQFVQAHNENGKLTPGEAIIAGMTGRYMVMLKQGRIQQANMMAYGILQAANLEASAHGAAGRDAIARGDYGAAKQHAVDGLNYIVDGVSQRLSADGQSVESYDPRTGQVTATTPFDGRIVLQTLMGLDNGNLFWKTLQASAQMLQKPDRNAEGRQLTNDLRRRQIAMADYRLAHPPAPRGGGGGGGTSTGMTKFQQDLARIRGERPPQQSVAAGAHSEDNSDLAFINYDVRDPDPEPEPAVAESHRSPSDLDEEDRYA